MNTRIVWVVALALAGVTAGVQACWYDVPNIANADTGTPEDGAVDALDAFSDAVIGDGGCNPNALFGAPVPLIKLNSPYNDQYPRLSPDERTIYFAQGSQTLPYRILVATRSSSTVPFSTAAMQIAEFAGTIPTNASDLNFSVAPDGLFGFLGSTRPEGTDASQIFFSYRGDASAPWSTPEWTGSTFGATHGDFDPYALQGKIYLAARPGPPYNSAIHAVYTAPPDVLDGGQDFPELQMPANAYDDFAPVVTPDELRLYFWSNRNGEGGVGPGHMWTSTRSSPTTLWVPPTMVTELASSHPGWVSADDCRLYIWNSTSDASTGDDLYVATRGM